jgi:hypothetical protein
MWDTSSMGPWMGETWYFFGTAKIKGNQSNPKFLEFCNSQQITTTDVVVVGIV